MNEIVKLEKETKHYDDLIKKQLKVKRQLDEKEVKLLKERKRLLNEIEKVKKETELLKKNVFCESTYKMFIKFEVNPKNGSTNSTVM